MEVGSQAWIDLIRNGAAEMGIPVSPGQAEAFAQHARALLAWNRKTNLTAITSPEEVAVKHFLDAIAPSRHIPSGAELLDIGSGGGFPGIPLKIMDPSLSVTLIDSVRKKTSFLNFVIRTLGLSGIEARHVRAEALATRAGMARRFDAVVCRALTALADFLRMARPLVKPGGLLIAMKGEISGEEAAEAEAAALTGGGSTIDMVSYTLPVLRLGRRLYLLRPSGDGPEPSGSRSGMNL